jgi:D-threo-aldose 1-dehydrogenase
MKQNSIGNTGALVSEIGLGCASLSGIFTPVGDADARATIDEALDNGIRYFDTAPFYGHGRSERLTGDQLRGKNYVLSTKVGRLLQPGAPADPGAWVQGLPFTPVYDYSYDGVMRSFDASLQRLGLDRIDIIFMHDIGNLTHGDTDGPRQFKIAMSGGYKAMDTLRREGRVKAIGLGVNESQVILDAMQHGDWDVHLLAGRYTLLEQAPLDDLFPACAKAGSRIIIGGAYNSGVLAGGNSFDYGAVPPHIVERVTAIRKVCAAHSVDLPAAALAFCRAHPLVVSTVPGPRSPAQLSKTLAWWDAKIPATFWADLKSQGLLRADAPTPA